MSSFIFLFLFLFIDPVNAYYDVGNRKQQEHRPFQSLVRNGGSKNNTNNGERTAQNSRQCICFHSYGLL